MSTELAYVMITPRTLAKGRHGGIISRLLSRTNLELIGARILVPTTEFAEEYATIYEKNNRDLPCEGKGPAEYIRNNFPPVNGLPQRSMLLLLQGENALEEVKSVVGLPTLDVPCDAMTICDTYADLIPSEDGTVIYAEPAVLTARTRETACEELKFLASFAEKSPNLAENIFGNDASAERTLVILKPENWWRPSTRPGAIMDILTRTGLRLVGCKMHRITVADAMEFYGPVQVALREKLAPKIAEKAKVMLEKEFGFELCAETDELLCKSVGQGFADNEFLSIVEFMSGTRPDRCSREERTQPGKAKCMVLIYEGTDPVKKVRDVLGPTDSAKAPGGTVRGEFGTNMMVNSAHASDSQESFVRESGILRVTENTLSSIIREFYP